MDTINNNNQTGLVVKRQVQVEAISKAVYLITDLFKEGEPLKMSLRRIAVECIEVTDKKESFLKLSSLIKLSRDMDLVTSMNADLLLKVIDDQLVDLTNKESRREVTIEDFLISRGNYEKKIDRSIDEDDSDKVMVIKEEEIEKAELVVEDKVEKKLPNITINNNTQNIKTINNISMDIGSRRKRILEIVKSRGAATINEFIDSIKGCSSKTIQRELTSLVLSGTLKKTGERRWSRYSLK
jgi:hypothetical protein